MERMLLAALMLLTLSSSAPAQVGGPEAVPASLPGTWKVSLCVEHGHAWIRYQHVETGEVHTVGRYARGTRSGLDPQTGKLVPIQVEESGLCWDLDLKYEPPIQRGRFLLLSVLVRNPQILEGGGKGYGHGRVRNNCATYARDAWAGYTGEYYHLPIIAAPDDLLMQVIRRHPEVVRAAKAPATPPAIPELPLPAP